MKIQFVRPVWWLQKAEFLLNMDLLMQLSTIELSKQLQISGDRDVCSLFNIAKYQRGIAGAVAERTWFPLPLESLMSHRIAWRSLFRMMVRLSVNWLVRHYSNCRWYPKSLHDNLNEIGQSIIVRPCAWWNRQRNKPSSCDFINTAALHPRCWCRGGTAVKQRPKLMETAIQRSNHRDYYREGGFRPSLRCS